MTAEQIVSSKSLFHSLVLGVVAPRPRADSLKFGWTMKGVPNLTGQDTGGWM